MLHWRTRKHNAKQSCRGSLTGEETVICCLGHSKTWAQGKEGGIEKEGGGWEGRERASALYRSVLKRKIVGMALCEGNGRMCGGASSLCTFTVGAAKQTPPTPTRTRVCRPLQTRAQAPMSHCRCANASLHASATHCIPGQQRRRRVCCRPGKRSQGRGNQMLGGLTFWALSVVTFQLPAWVRLECRRGSGGWWSSPS